MGAILKYSRFIHVPKTGGTWVTNALVRSCSHCLVDERLHRHATLQTAVGDGLFTFGFVRHPAHWWRSYWVFRMMHGWSDVIPLDVLCKAEDFNEFIEKVLRHQPGYLTREIHEPFLGGPGQEIDFIGRYETLVEDLVTALEKAGEAFNTGLLRQTPPAMVGDYERFAATYDPSLLEGIVEAEADSFRRFGYSPSL